MKASKKLITASFALVAALAVSVGTTYAWFTTNNKVTVEKIEASVTTGDSNLEVALIDPTTGNLKTGFSYSLDLSKELADELANLKWDALTDQGTLSQGAWQSAGSGKNGLDLHDKKGGAGVAATSEDKGNYLTFYLRFRTPATSETKAEGLSLVLSDSSKVESKHDNRPTASPAGNYSPLVAPNNLLTTDYSIAADAEIETNAKDAMRVAFHPATKNAVTKDDGSDGLVWTPNTSTYDTILAGSGQSSEPTKNLAQAVEAILAGATSDTYATEYAKFNDLYNDPAYEAYSTPGTETVLTLKDDDETNPVYCTADLCVVIWLEGTDPDCLNSIFSDIVTITLGFEIPED